MKKPLLVLSLALVLGVTGCAKPAVDTEAEANALMQTSRDWAKAVAGGDVEAALSYWADDAVVMAPDQPAIVSKAALREFVLGMQKIPGFSITWEPERAVISSAGDMGYLIEHNRTTFAAPSGEIQTQFGKAVTIWRKDASGAWKCVVDAWNNNPTERVLNPAGD